MQVVDFVNLDYEVLRDTIFLSNFRVVADLPCLRGRSARIAYRTNICSSAVPKSADLVPT